jgi:hypothetical protein
LAFTVQQAKKSALEVLLHNLRGPFASLPRTAGWGYPEPYTRDMMISSLGFLSSGNDELIHAVRLVLLALAESQTEKGQIASLASDPSDLGSSDTTPLFLIGLALFRQVTGDSAFLERQAQRAILWMEYQSPDESALIGQLPTTDWRDEQWVLGYGLYVNTLAYLCAVMWDRGDAARRLNRLINQTGLRGSCLGHRVHEGLRVPGKPYYSLWVYKVFRNERFDLLGNSLAILSGLPSKQLSEKMVLWVEQNCGELKEKGDLVVDLPPCLFPFILPSDQDWQPRMESYNRVGDYHNGGVWPFICGFYIAALVKCGEYKLAEEKLEALTALVQKSRDPGLGFGFNEWYKAQDGLPKGQDWQTWSAAMYLYAANTVEQRETFFFDEL